MFYTYTQNNSGGSFISPAIHVIIEAENSSEADSIAQYNGIYFNGCESGSDCPCCGDRWYPSGTWEESEDPRIYGKTPEEYVKDPKSFLWGTKKVPNCKVFYQNGDIKIYD